MLLGAFIGLAIGTTGIGGGLLAAPLLILFFGVPPAQSVGTALLFSSAVKVNAALLYLYRRQVDLRTLPYMVAGGVPGAVFGSAVLERLHDSRDGLILTVIGATVLVSAGFGLLRFVRDPVRHRERPWLLLLLSFPIGVSTGFSSAGAGALGTVLLYSLSKLSPVAVVGTDLVFGLAVSVAGSLVHVTAGSWSRVVLFPLLASGVAGACLGAWLAGVLPARILRVTVLLWAMLLGAIVLHKGLGRGF